MGAAGPSVARKWERMTDNTGEEKRGLVAEAARVAEAVGAAAGIGSLRRYLDAYYWHVSDEDLVPICRSTMATCRARHSPASSSWVSRSSASCHWSS